jgi:hypothetical protein
MQAQAPNQHVRLSSPVRAAQRPLRKSNRYHLDTSGKHHRDRIADATFAMDSNDRGVRRIRPEIFGLSGPVCSVEPANESPISDILFYKERCSTLRAFDNPVWPTLILTFGPPSFVFIL